MTYASKKKKNHKDYKTNGIMNIIHFMLTLEYCLRENVFE